MFSNRHRLRVIYGDTDRMGIVYYANHFRYFEAGRNELLRAAGVDYRKIEEEGAMLPVVEATCRYRSPAYYDDELELETFVSDLGLSSLRIGYRLVRLVDGVLIATGETRHACVRPDGPLRRMPPEIKEKLNAHGHDP